MNLPPADANLFFKLMWALQFYVNQRLQIQPHLDTLDVYAAAPMQEKAPVRNALYENIELLDAFVAENPAGLSPDELAIAKNWKRFVADDFFLERFLKKGTIFLDSKSPTKVYSVLGLHDSLQDMFYGRRPPIRIQTILLPFKGKIVYDGMMGVYSIFFGKGIRTSLKETYMAAKQNDRIIITLEPEQQPQKKVPRKPLPDWRPLIDEIAKTSKKLKGSRQAPIQSQAINLLKAGANLAQTAVHDPGDLDELWKLARKAKRTLDRLETVLHRAEW